MKLVFVGADHEVTGSCHYLEAAGIHMLVDRGMEQGINPFENAPLPVPEAQIDYVFLTHAHVDHSGMLPQLYARGFRGQIFATRATAQLCDIMLRDCAHIQQQEAEWKSRKAKRHSGAEVYEPPYTMEDAEGAISLLVPCDYQKEIEVCEGVRIRFTDIGHLLGSSSIEVWLKENGIERKLCFSGDVGNLNQPLIRNPQKTAQAEQADPPCFLCHSSDLRGFWPDSGHPRRRAKDRKCRRHTCRIHRRSVRKKGGGQKRFQKGQGSPGRS